MKRINLILPVVLIAFYIGMFFLQESLTIKNKEQLSYIPPYRFLLAALGYIRQMGAEGIYVKTSVYLGGNHSSKTLLKNEKSLSDHFLAASKIHPKFKDTYFLCEGFLPSLSKESANRANEVLTNGREAQPDFFIYGIFSAFNCFYYLDEYGKAANILKDILKNNSDAPPWLGHLASILSVQGGDLYTGLNWLKMMHNGEKDEKARGHYEKEIRIFENAISVQQATVRYKNKYGVFPEKLDMIVPEFMGAIPDPGKDFVYNWSPPNLKLMRPKTLGKN